VIVLGHGIPLPIYTCYKFLSQPRSRKSFFLVTLIPIDGTCNDIHTLCWKKTTQEPSYVSDGEHHVPMSLDLTVLKLVQLEDFEEKDQ